MNKKMMLRRTLNKEDALAKKKLELEIKQLNQPYFLKTLLPIFLQFLLVTMVSLVLVYRTNIFDAKQSKIDAQQNHIDAKLKYGETILKTIELEQKKNKLSIELDSFTIHKKALVLDSISIAQRLDSMLFVMSNLEWDKNQLYNKVISLRDSKSKLEDEAGFYVINKNLHELKGYPGPNYKFVEEIEKVITDNSIYKNRTIDTLLEFSKDAQLKYISLFILYKTTNLVSYRDLLFKEITIVLSQLKDPEKDGTNGVCLQNDFKSILYTNKWPTNDKYLLANVLLSNYENIPSKQGKFDILYCVSQYAYCDTAYNLYQNNSSIFWDYLKYNRDIFLSNDTTIDRSYILLNISNYCPQLVFALAVNILSKPIENNDPQKTFAFLKWGTFMNNPTHHITKKIYDFNAKNNLVGNHLPPYYLEKYNKDKNNIDSWIIGNFDRFRKDDSILNNCIKNNCF